jgi:hypothetical protein
LPENQNIKGYKAELSQGIRNISDKYGSLGIFSNHW